MSSKQEIAGKGSLGMFLSEKKTMVFEFRNFENLEDENHVTTNVSCHGHSWCLQIYPFGRTEEAKTDGCVSVYLTLKTRPVPATNVKTKYCIRAAGVAKRLTHVFDLEGWGWEKFVERSKALTALDSSGTLTISVDLQVWTEKKPEWQPNLGFRQKLVKLYQKDDDMDITFWLGKDRVRAHQHVLAIQCPVLYDMTAGEANCSKVKIEGADPDMFATMIRYMYFEALPGDFDLKTNGIDLLKLANKFSYTDLKLHLEHDIVESGMVAIENAAEILLLADAHSFALLKEVAMNLVGRNPFKVTKTAGWADLKQSASLLAEVYERPSELLADDDTVEPEKARVSNLRKRLAERGFDVDGTREMLVKRLKTSQDEDGENDE